MLAHSLYARMLINKKCLRDQFHMAIVPCWPHLVCMQCLKPSKHTRRSGEGTGVALTHTCVYTQAYRQDGGGAHTASGRGPAAGPAYEGWRQAPLSLSLSVCAHSINGCRQSTPRFLSAQRWPHSPRGRACGHQRRTRRGQVPQHWSVARCMYAWAWA